MSQAYRCKGFIRRRTRPAFCIASLASFVVVLSSCTETNAPPRSGPEVLHERRELQAAAPTKAIGEDCTAVGRSDCLSGLCLKTANSEPTQRICSKICLSDGDCPISWRCNPLHPNAPRVCVPSIVALGVPLHP